MCSRRSDSVLNRLVFRYGNIAGVATVSKGHVESPGIIIYSGCWPATVTDTPASVVAT
jgi:hypothetical protein